MSSPAKSRKLFFLGAESEFFEQVQDKFEMCDRGHFNYSYEYGEWNEFFLILDLKTPDLLFIDFSSLHDEKKIAIFFNNILKIKRSQNFKQIPIIGIYENKEQILNLEVINHIGMNYLHIIGDDLNLFFGNIYYIAFEDESNLLKLARALKMQLKMNLLHDCLIEGINSFQLRVSSDIIFEEEFKSQISKCFEGRDLSFTISEMEGNSSFSSCYYTYALDLDLSEGEWDSAEELEAEVCVDDFKSWHSTLTHDSIIGAGEQVVVQFFTSKPSWALNLVSEKSVTEVQVNLNTSFNESEASQTASPDFVIFECGSSESLDEADLLLSYYSNERIQPIILLLNHPSQTQAIKKMYDYEKVLVYTDELTLIAFDQMINLINKNHPRKEEFELYKSITDAMTLSYPVEIMITSLTENEVTFMTEVEIPYYSHLALRVDNLDVGLVVVPSHINLSPNVKGFHYISLINRCSEADRQALRGVVKTFVNQLPEKWTDIGLLSFKPEITEDHASHVKEESVEAHEKMTSDEPRELPKNDGVKRAKSSLGKSKL